MLRRYKAKYFQQPPQPGVTPVSEELAAAQLGVQSAWRALSAGRRPGRNDPCPCGSGKKC